MNDLNHNDSDLQENIDETLAANEVDQAELERPAEQKADLAQDIDG